MVKCEICEREFKNNYGLARHLVSKHKDITTRDYFEKYIPQKYCKCGCGKLTPIKQGAVRADYILGHNLIPSNKARIGTHRTEEVKEKIRIKLKGRKLSEATKQKISEAQGNVWTAKRKQEARERVLNDKHPNWKGGRPKRKGMYKGNTRELVEACRLRDKNICQMCGATKANNKGRNMSVHHINPYCDSYDNSIDNLICLCQKCHAIADRNNMTKEEIKNYNR